MKSEDKHKWNTLPTTDEIGIGKVKHWICTKCGCERHLGLYKFAAPGYSRSGQVYPEHRPDCVDMSRRSYEPLD